MLLYYVSIPLPIPLFSFSRRELSFFTTRETGFADSIGSPQQSLIRSSKSEQAYQNCSNLNSLLIGFWEERDSNNGR